MESGILHGDLRKDRDLSMGLIYKIIDGIQAQSIQCGVLLSKMYYTFIVCALQPLQRVFVVV